MTLVIKLSPLQKLSLKLFAVFGLLGPNGVFLYIAFMHPQEFRTSMANPVTMAFVVEALAVMVLLAILIRALPAGRWGWKSFIAMSLAGGLGFSIPAFLLLNAQQPADTVSDGPQTPQQY